MQEGCVRFIMFYQFGQNKRPSTNNFRYIKLDGIPTKIKWKIHACFAIYSKFWRQVGTSEKCYKIHLPVLLFIVLHQFLYQLIPFFYNFLELYSKLSENRFPSLLVFHETSIFSNLWNIFSISRSIVCVLRKIFNVLRNSFLYFAKHFQYFTYFTKHFYCFVKHF